MEDEDKEIAFVLYPDGTLDVYDAGDYTHDPEWTLEEWREHLQTRHSVPEPPQDIANATDLHGGLHFLAGDRP